MSTTSQSSVSDNARECMALVRNHSIDRYLATLFFPEKVRFDVFALYAFDAEICNIQNLVKEPMMGEIRLQWWRDLIAGERQGEAANHPVALPFLTAVKQHQLPIMSFDNYLKARIFDLYHDPMPDLGTFEGYAGETISIFFQHVAAILAGSAVSAATSTAAGHAGVVWALVDILKNMAAQRARGQCYVPADLMARAGVLPEIYHAGGDDPMMTALVGELIKPAREHLSKFEQALAGLPETCRAAFLPMCLIAPYLAQAEKSGPGVTGRPVDIAQWRKQIYLWRASRTGKY